MLTWGRFGAFWRVTAVRSPLRGKLPGFEMKIQQGGGGEKLPSFRNPPVVEVVFGIRFATSLPMQTRHLGQLWQALGSDYPETEDAFPLIDAEEVPAKMSPIPALLRRIRAYSGDRHFLLQIQDTRLYVNWIKADAPVVYPRFEAVQSRFEAAWSGLVRFAESQDLGRVTPGRFELTYVNRIGAGGRVADIAEGYLKTLRFSDLEGEQFARPRGLNATWKFDMPNDAGEGSVMAVDGAAPGGPEGLVLTFACAGAPSEVWDRAKWFAAAHTWIVRGFTELTTPKGHGEWGREQ